MQSLCGRWELFPDLLQPGFCNEKEKYKVQSTVARTAVTD